jgi:hypothetical protein
VATDHRVLNLTLTNKANNSLGKDSDLNESSFVKQDSIKSKVKNLVLERINQLTTKNDLETALEKIHVPENQRKLFFDAIGEGLGSVVSGVGDGIGSVVSGVGNGVKGLWNGLTGQGGGDDAEGENEEGGDGGSGPGLGIGIGAAAAGAGMMKKQQREMEHRYALKRVENEMAAAQFSADFQDQAISELSKTFGTAKFVDGRIKSINKNLDYSIGQLVGYFYQTLV